MLNQTKRPIPHDPMREIDLLLLEDIMMRRNFDTTARQRALQTGGILLVLASLIVVFIHALTHQDIVAAGNSPQATTEVPIGSIAARARAARQAARESQ